jgi:molybdopterin synthase catalytic subunit
VADAPSGGVHVRVQEADFDPGREIEAVRDRATGAIVSFVGIAREFSESFSIERITLEHYPGMTERCLEDIGHQALVRWNLQAVRIVHRHGELLPGDRIVLVATASTHRDAAFDACRFVVDFLKTQAPFWKREAGQGGARWVEAKQSDELARDRWLHTTVRPEPSP